MKADTTGIDLILIVFDHIMLVKHFWPGAALLPSDYEKRGQQPY
jgi:hypothetical protein